MALEALLVCPPTWPWPGHYDHGYIRASPPKKNIYIYYEKFGILEGALEGAFEEQSWLTWGTQETEGWTGPAEAKETHEAMGS